eukprot:1377659-Prymnesium_polylepis.1
MGHIRGHRRVTACEPCVQLVNLGLRRGATGVTRAGVHKGITGVTGGHRAAKGHRGVTVLRGHRGHHL